MRRFLLIDGSSIGHAANNGTLLKVGDTPVQAIFGFMRTLRKLKATYPNHEPVVLWDGASWRKMLFATYKEGRDKSETAADKKLLVAKDMFKAQLASIKKGVELLGVPQVWAINMEADDLAGMMADMYVARGDKIVLISGDKDWIQLVGPSTIWVDPIQDRRVTMANFEEFTGVQTTEQFVQMKCLCGDAGDSVPGVGGIGEKGAVEFLKEYGSFTNFSNMALEASFDLKKLPKKFRDLATDEGKRMAFVRNMQLMDLRTTARPAPLNMTITPGTPDADRFRRYCEMLSFKSIYSDLDNWLSVFTPFQPQEEAA